MSDENITRNSSFERRAHIAKNPVAQRLFKLMAEKKTNLCVAADLTDQRKLLNFIRKVGEEVVAVKTHVDILEDWNQKCAAQLRDISNELDFLLFEDRKFADIGRTVRYQYSGGMYSILDWAHLVTAHGISGEGIITSLKEAALGKAKQRGCLLLAQMTTADHLFTPAYSKRIVEMGKMHEDFIAGFISSNQPDQLSALLANTDPQFVLFTPGTHIMAKQDTHDQRYTHPSVLMQSGTDVIIVGRAITKAIDPKETAADYRRIAWKGYQDRISSSSGR